MENPVNFRKLIILFFGLLIAAGFLAWLFNYLHTGTIIITSHTPGNTITLTSIGDSSVSFTGHGKLSVNVHTGEYIASVKANSIEATQIIKLSSHKTLSYTVNAVNAAGMEPVLYKDAQAVAADSTQLVYLDKNGAGLYKIDAKNNLTSLGIGLGLQSIKWAGPGFGVGQDGQGKLFVVNEGSIKPLAVPFPYSETAIPGYSVSPDRHIYLSNDKNIYFGSASGQFKKIYTGDSTYPALTGSPGHVAISESVGEAGEAGSVIATVSTEGKVASKATEASNPAWSPNGKYLAASTSSGAKVFDSTLHEITNIPTRSSVDELAWLNDTSLFYSVNDQIWSYNITSQKSRLFANTPLNQNVAELSVSTDKAYLYMVTVGADGSFAIRRIGLEGQKTPENIYELQSILPEDLDSYSIGLVNFTRLDVLVEPYAIDPSTDYVAKAKIDLADHGFNANDLQFQLQHTATDGD